MHDYQSYNWKLEYRKRQIRVFGWMRGYEIYFSHYFAIICKRDKVKQNQKKHEKKVT